MHCAEAGGCPIGVTSAFGCILVFAARATGTGMLHLAFLPACPSVLVRTVSGCHECKVGVSLAPLALFCVCMCMCVCVLASVLICSTRSRCSGKWSLLPFWLALSAQTYFLAPQNIMLFDGTRKPQFTVLARFEQQKSASGYLTKLGANVLASSSVISGSYNHCPHQFRKWSPVGTM